MLVAGQLVSVHSQPAVAEDILLRLNIVPPAVEAELGASAVGFVSIVNSIGFPVLAPRDLEVSLSSRNPAIALVPQTVVIPQNSHYAKFNVRVGDTEGDTEISAIYQNQLVTSTIRVTKTSPTVPEDLSLRLHLPTNKMFVNSEMPLSVFLESTGNLTAAPDDIKIVFNYEKKLLSLESDTLVIQKGRYYALTTVRTLDMEGSAFIRATTDGPPKLSASANIQISSALPARLTIYALPDRITIAESSIDIFVGLLDQEGAPTFARSDIILNLFSNSTLLSERLQKSSQVRDFVIKKNQFGFYMRQEVFFDKAQENIMVGVSAAGFESDAAHVDVLPALFARDPQVTDQRISVYAPAMMPTNGEAIMVYQLNAKERDANDCPLFDEHVREIADLAIEELAEEVEEEEEEEDIPENDKDLLIVPLTTEILNECAKLGFRDIHPIDLLDEGEIYPIQSEITHSKEKPIPDLFVTSADSRVISINKAEKISVGKSYGTALISGGDRVGTATLSASVQGVGSGTNQTTVISRQAVSQTLIFSPTGTDRIGLDRGGLSDLFIMTMDSSDRPVSSKGEKYLITPLNELTTIEPAKSFTRLLVDSSEVSDISAGGSIDISVVPVGAEARTELAATSTFDLVPYLGTRINVFLPFVEVLGFSKSNPIGVVQLTDTFGRPVLAQSDLVINLESSDARVVQVPPSVTIPEGRSYVEFTLATFGKSGSATISADTEGLIASTVKINSRLRDLPGAITLSGPYEPTVENKITVSTLEGASVLWAVPASMEVVGKDEKAVTYDEATNSYLAQLRIVPQVVGNFTLDATLLKDGYQPKTLTEFVFVEELPTRLFIFFEYPHETIPFNETQTVQIYVDNEKAESVPGALIDITGVNATVSPTAFMTGLDGGGIVTFRATGPGASMIVTAAKEGYTTGQDTFMVEITGLIEEEAKLFGLPSWVVYAGAGGAAAGVVVTFMFLMKRGKAVEEEEEEI